MIRTLFRLSAAALLIAPLAATAQHNHPESTSPPTPVVTGDPVGPAVQVQANPVGQGSPVVTEPNPQVANDPVPPALPADPAYRAGPYKGALTAPPPEAMNKVYPVCTRTLRDSCRNPGGR